MSAVAVAAAGGRGSVAAGRGVWGHSGRACADCVGCRAAYPCAQVLTSYEEGVYNILFDSIPDDDIRPEWRARAVAQWRAVRLRRCSEGPLTGLAAGACAAAAGMRRRSAPCSA